MLVVLGLMFLSVYLFLEKLRVESKAKILESYLRERESEIKVMEEYLNKKLESLRESLNLIKLPVFKQKRYSSDLDSLAKEFKKRGF